MLNSSKKVDLLVCTNRYDQDFPRIWSQILSQEKLKKVVLATQGQANQFKNREKKVQHLALESKGRSKALITGLKETSAFAVALTDDDCVLDKNWLSESLDSLGENVGLVYGQTKPYQPEKNPDKFCPSTFSKKPNRFSITSSLGKHWLEVGFDNNVLIKKTVFEQIGPYKWWMGPGCLVPAAEDAEFILRSLIAGYKIAYNPRMLAYHDRFLTAEEFEKQLLAYNYGGLVAYGFYALQGVKECREIFIDHLKVFFYPAKKNLKEIIKGSWSVILFKDFFLNAKFLLQGIFWAWFFAKVMPIPEKENVVKRFYKSNVKKNSTS